MGLGKKFKKSLKRVISGAKTIAKNPLSKEGLMAAGAMATGGMTGGLLASEYAGERRATQLSDENAAQYQQAVLQQNTQKAYGYNTMADLVAARKRKEQQLASREETRATGISSLIGRGSTLG